MNNKAKKHKSQTPPMGWRSWNLFGDQVNQTLMMNVKINIIKLKHIFHAYLNVFCKIVIILILCQGNAIVVSKEEVCGR